MGLIMSQLPFTDVIILKKNNKIDKIGQNFSTSILIVVD